MRRAKIVPNIENFNTARRTRALALKGILKYFLKTATDDLWSGHHMYLNPLRFNKGRLKERLGDFLDEILRDMDRRYEILRNDNIFFTQQTEDGKLKYKREKR
jgi:hypothetical protein